jgi:hypothetical protein
LQIGEIAAATTGHKDFLAYLIGAFEHHGAPATLPGDDRAHEACSTTAKNNDIKLGGHGLCPRKLTG